LSSILRALRKLDEETLHPEDHTGDRKIKMKRMINRRARTPMLIKRLLFISLALLLLSTAVLIIVKSSRNPSISSEESAEEPPVETTPPAITSEQSRPAEISVFSEKGRQTRSGKEADRVQPATGKRITQKTAVQSKMEKNNETGFILNGIIWSDNPAMRVALINGQYLKEGDSIDGVSVIEIKEKAVTLQRGQEKWTIRLEK